MLRQRFQIPVVAAVSMTITALPSPQLCYIQVDDRVYWPVSQLMLVSKTIIPFRSRHILTPSVPGNWLRDTGSAEPSGHLSKHSSSRAIEVGLSARRAGQETQLADS